MTRVCFCNVHSTTHPTEPCILTKAFEAGRVTIALLIDDLLIAANLNPRKSTSQRLKRITSMLKST
jgi:phosphopantetheine adenylyltransferase